jgi:small subunit ribosomal protein S17
MRTRRHVFQGIVVSHKADKTRVVHVQRQVRHPLYEKILRMKSKFYVHDEGNESRAGDFVEIMGTRPLSKLKRWRLVRVIKTTPRTTPQKDNRKEENSA